MSPKKKPKAEKGQCLISKLFSQTGASASQSTGSSTAAELMDCEEDAPADIVIDAAEVTESEHQPLSTLLGKAIPLASLR